MVENESREKIKLRISGTNVNYLENNECVGNIHMEQGPHTFMLVTLSKDDK